MNDGPPPGEFPSNQGPNRFHTADGSNPFKDDISSDSPAENPFAGPAGPFAAAANREHYVAILPHRSAAVLALGIGGFFGVTIGSLGLFCCLPFPLFALALSIPAWLMGRMDLKAMDAGAMDGSGRGTTTVGYWLGLLATLIALLICLGFAGWLASQAIGGS